MVQRAAQTSRVTRFADLIRVIMRRDPRAVALVGYDRTCTYAQLCDRAARLAQGLLSLGLAPGDAVGILSRNRIEYIETYMALQFAGLVAVPVNFRLASTEVHFVLSHCGAKGLIVEEPFREMVESLLPQLPAVRADAVVAIGGADGSHAQFERLIDVSAPLSEPVAVAPGDPATIFYTSGTTGFPKGAAMSHLNILTRFTSWGWEFGLCSDDVVIVPGPVFHNSFSAIALITLAVGGRVVLMNEFEPARAASLVEQHGVTWGFLVPKMIEDLLAAMPDGGGRSLRGLLSSGAPLPQPLLDDLVRRLPHAKLWDAYGWTETGWLTICRHSDLVGGKKSVGRAGFGCEIAILAPDGAERPRGDIGEIHASNPVSFLGYHDNPEATRAARKGRWETGGDVGYMDEDGFLYLVDRKNDMIISGGENIYPAEIERVLVTYPKIMEVTVVAVPDPKWGESPRACVVLRPGEQATIEDICAYCDGRLARYKHPRSVVFIDALPRNAMGKVLRRELRDRFAQAPGTSVA